VEIVTDSDRSTDTKSKPLAPHWSAIFRNVPIEIRERVSTLEERLAVL